MNTRRSTYRSNENGEHRQIRTAPREHESNHRLVHANRQFTTENFILFLATHKKKKTKNYVESARGNFGSYLRMGSSGRRRAGRVTFRRREQTTAERSGLVSRGTVTRDGRARAPDA